MDTYCREVGCLWELNSIAEVRRQRNPCDPNVPSDIEELKAEPGMMTEGLRHAGMLFTK